MNSNVQRQVLFYPFHLCHEQTLNRLLSEFSTVHFMDYMAIQLTEMTGLTAFPDRMGDSHPDLVAAGRIVQGHTVSGHLDAVMVADIDRDFSDALWRATFHQALKDNRRFQRGLLDLSHGMIVGGSIVPGPAVFLCLTREDRQHHPISVDSLKRLSRKRTRGDDAYVYEYALALLKTAAALRYAIRLCASHTLQAATDSAPHHRLLELTKQREALSIHHQLVHREGY